MLGAAKIRHWSRDEMSACSTQRRSIKRCWARCRLKRTVFTMQFRIQVIKLMTSWSAWKRKTNKLLMKTKSVSLRFLNVGLRSKTTTCMKRGAQSEPFVEHSRKNMNDTIVKSRWRKTRVLLASSLWLRNVKCSRRWMMNRIASLKLGKRMF